MNEVAEAYDLMKKRKTSVDKTSQEVNLINIYYFQNDLIKLEIFRLN